MYIFKAYLPYLWLKIQAYCTVLPSLVLMRSGANAALASAKSSIVKKRILYTKKFRKDIFLEAIFQKHRIVDHYKLISISLMVRGSCIAPLYFYNFILLRIS